MRWRIIEPVMPELWSTRMVTRFAWRPTTVQSRWWRHESYTVWLEKFVEKQQYMGLSCGGWNCIARYLA